MFQKILLIIQREYLTRVRKRSFIVMTILGPLLMAGMIVVPIYLSTLSNEQKTIGVIDDSRLAFVDKFKNSEDMKFRHVTEPLDSAKAHLATDGDYALLYIPFTEPSVPSTAFLYAQKQVNINVKSYISNTMVKELENIKLAEKLKDVNAISGQKITREDILESIKSSINLETIRINENGEEKKSYTEVTMVVGMFAAFLIYFFIFLFGTQVMRGVIEEKTSRIIEVIVSSVRPFELMMGKILGIALVGITQFLLWVLLTAGIVTTATTMLSSRITQSEPGKIMAATHGLPGQDAMADSTKTAQMNSQNMGEVFDAIQSIDFPVMIASFLFFFLFGYLMYAALFAAIGSAVDSETDTQQFMLPITIPLILAIMMAQFIIQNPEGPVAFWFSIIPLTSPVVMMIRIPFGVPIMEVILSMVLLVLGFLGTTWMASKIYRTGILMYGKKVNYKELWKWIRYKS